MQKRNVAFYIFLLIFANAIWGASDVVAKAAVARVTPFTLAWLRLTVALMAFLPIIVVNRKKIPRSIKSLAPFFALGASGFFLNFVVCYTALQYAPASHSTALRISESLFIVVLSAIILRERIGKNVIVAFILAAIGVVLVLNINFANLGLFGANYILGDLLIIASIFIESFYTIIGKRVLVKTDPLTTTALASLFGWTMLSVFFGRGVLRELSEFDLSWQVIAAAIYLGLFASAIGYCIWYVALSKLLSHRVAISLMIQPVIGIPLAAMVFGDRITLKFIFGAVLIATGVFLALRKNPQNGVKES